MPKRLPLVVLLLMLLASCRGPVRNPAALTPLPPPDAILPPTSTVIPSATVPPTATPVVVIHVVEEGESLFAIALLYGTTVEAIRAANGIPDGENRIDIGQELVIPIEP